MDGRPSLTLCQPSLEFRIALNEGQYRDLVGGKTVILHESGTALTLSGTALTITLDHVGFSAMKDAIAGAEALCNRQPT